MDVLRYRAFTCSLDGSGNPAGVVLDASGMTDDDMLAVAAQVGYSETSFVVAGEGSYRVRYFSPVAEVDFCGHATIATAVALAEDGAGAGELLFLTNVGEILVTVVEAESGYCATLRSVPPMVAAPQELLELLGALGWELSDLDADLPFGLAFAGLWHPIVWANSRDRLAELDYDFEGLKDLMVEHGWGTVSLLYREAVDLIHSRNAFPIGGVIEDPATGAAAAALGGFLREHQLLPEDGKFVVIQGEDMDMPCRIDVDASGDGGVAVTGTAEMMATP